MKNTLIRLALIGGLATAVVAATGAFFSDTETSAGNTLVAGAIDLKVDNTCYYNGQACTNGFWGGVEANGACSCTWESKDLDENDLFFDLTDIKPGDWEEDTISLTVQDNESWLCADVTLRSDDDVTCTDPENEAEGPLVCQVPGAGLGELADALNFLWWADDGDNVLEVGETTLPSGPLGVLAVGETATVTLADSLSNIWGLQGPIPQGGDTFYIGKGWCFGAITETPVDQDGFGATGTNGPDSLRGGGFSCDGSGEGNKTQTDALTADISFRAVQARNNTDFVCQPQL